jgi:hypothetical protein
MSTIPRARKTEEKMPTSYQDGAEGCIRFCEDHIRVPIYVDKMEYWCPLKELPSKPNPKTGRSYKDMWEAQKDILRECLAMDSEGFFIYRQIIFCWMRGEGKSLIVCLIVLWKFCCFSRQKIMLGANSRDQVKFVHYDIIRDIIQHSPSLKAIIGEKNIQEKEVRLKEDPTDPKDKNIDCIIRSVGTFTGILSNITAYTFSEMFDMRNPRFYVQLDGSIRNIPNAFGLIDSTVSDKTHVLYNLFKEWKAGNLRNVYFSYRCSRNGDPDDYWNPLMDADQLNDYRVKFPFGEFERYFQNLWEAGTVRVFTDEMIEEMGYIGVDNGFMNHNEIQDVIKRKQELILRAEDTAGKGFNEGAAADWERVAIINNRFRRVETLYTLDGPFSETPPPVSVLQLLSDVFDTDWALLTGLDMADPTAVRGQARTIFCAALKGLIGSRSNPFHETIEIPDMKYIYILIFLASIQNQDINIVKRLMDEMDGEYDGIDAFCSERYGSWDMVQWCEDRDIFFEPVFPNYDRQREAFKEFYNVAREGRFKSPAIHVVGSKQTDVFREELSVFDHDPIKRWFGSPEKTEKGGIQDDSVYSVGWCMYGGRMFGPDSFRVRKSITNFGTFIQGTGTVGDYT